MKKGLSSFIVNVIFFASAGMILFIGHYSLLPIFAEFENTDVSSNTINNINKEGWDLLLSFQNHKAIKLFDQVLQIDNNIEALDGKGLAYRQLGQLDIADELFSKVLDINDNSSKGLSGKGYAYYRLNNYDEANKILDKALSIDNKNKEALSYKGTVLRETDKPEAIKLKW